MRFLIFILISLLLMAGCDPMNLPDKPHPSGLGPCERYNTDCDCTVLFTSGASTDSAYDAETILGHYYFDNIALPQGLGPKDFTCKANKGFYDCYADGEYYASCNDGDIIKAECR